MKLSEKHHAAVLKAFYEGFVKALGYERGRDAFLLAERAYGERRGRRMAMRALRNGDPLDFTSYFAYGELLSTPGAYVGSFEASDGLVHETQIQCPWATAFKEQDALECAKLYCAEIDAAVVRGFCPGLDYRYGGNMHEQGRCVFDFRSPELNASSLEEGAKRLAPGRSGKKDMSFHSGDVYQMFCHTAKQICPAALPGIKEDLRKSVGDEAFETLEELAAEDHESV